MNDKSFALSKEQAEKIFKDKQKYIKTSIKKKIAIYEPLDVKTAYQGFTKWVQNEDFNVFRNMPENCTVDVFLDDLIKNFLIQHAYYVLAEKYIQQRIMNKLGILDPNDIRVFEIVDFIIEGIEKNELKRLITFEERAKFKTFLSTVISSLLMDFWRQKYQKEKHVTKYGPEFEEMFDEPQKDPLETLIHLESEETKNKAAEFLPRILDQLEGEEKLAIKMKYQKSMKTSEIARTLGRTRFKTEKFIKQIEMNISLEILSEVKRGGSHEAP